MYTVFVVAREVVVERNAYGTLSRVQYFPVRIEQLQGQAVVHHLTNDDYLEPVGFESFQEAQAVAERYLNPAETDGRLLWDHQAGDWLEDSEPEPDCDPDFYYECYREDFHSDG